MNERGWGNVKPPIGAVVNWNHPITKGLYGCWLLNEGAGIRTKGLGLAPVSDGTLTGTNAKWDAGPRGLEYDYTSGNSNSFINFNWAPGFDKTSPFSIEILGFFPTAGTSQQYICGNMPSVNTGPGFALTIDVSSANNLEFRLHNNSTDRIIKRTANACIQNNTWYHTLVTYDGSVTAAGVHFYVNGIEQTSIVTVADALTASTVSASNWTLGRSGLYTGIGSATGNRYALHRVWNRVLSPNEAKRLFISPYEMFTSPKRRNIAIVPITLALAGTADISLDTTGNLVGNSVLGGAGVLTPTVSGDLRVLNILAGIANINLSVAGQLVVSVVLAGTADISFLSLGNLTLVLVLQGTANVVMVVTGDLRTLGVLGGVAILSPEVSGLLLINSTLSGVSSVVFGVTGDLHQILSLMGIVDLSTDVIGLLLVLIKLYGYANLDSVVSGNLQMHYPFNRNNPHRHLVVGGSNLQEVQIQSIQHIQQIKENIVDALD